MFQICSRCKKRPAVVFITKVENNESKPTGLCIQCARELNVGPIEQIIKQTGKLIETKLIFSVEPSFSLIREILLIKFDGKNTDVAELERLVDIYGARVVDRTSGCIVVELTDTPHRIDGFIDDTKDFAVVESCRSGAIAMERGDVSYEL